MATTSNQDENTIQGNSGTQGTQGDMAELIKQFTAVLVNDKKQVKVKEPAIYNSARDALVIDSWIRSVERYINFHDWSAEGAYLFAATLFHDRADAWYRTIENTDEAPIT